MFRAKFRFIYPALFLLAAMDFALAKPLLEVLEKDRILPAGQWREAVVPDTLDLAERARLAIRFLTNNVKQDLGYAACGFNFFEDDFGLRYEGFELTAVNLQNLPWMRVMCGSDENIDVEKEMMNTHLEAVGPDGLMYVPINAYGTPEGTAFPIYNGFMGLAVVNAWGRDKDPRWLDWLHHLCDGLDKAAIRVEDRAYYPPDCGITPEGEWKYTARSQTPNVTMHGTSYVPPEEPDRDISGYESAVKWHYGSPIKALIKDWLINSDEESLELAGRFIRFCLKPGMWVDKKDPTDRRPCTTAEGYLGNEHGIFDRKGHFYSNVELLDSMLNYAIVTNDAWMKQFVRNAYHYAFLRGGAARIGNFDSRSEACSIQCMIRMAVAMSDAGIGDYWDDVDHFVRNQLIEEQLIDLDQMRRCSGVEPGTLKDELLQRLRGGFTSCGLLQAKAKSNRCCSANGPAGLYYAWHGITRFDEGTGVVNLWLNRAAPWLDVESYLPYEGQLIVRNRKCGSIMIRVPQWLGMEDVNCFVNDRPVQPACVGRYLVFHELKRRAVIRLECPVPQSELHYTIGNQKCVITLRGSTVVDIQPRGKLDPENYWLYQRDHMKAQKAPMKKTKQFIAGRIIPLH